MPKGRIWLGLSSKDLLNLQLKTELYADSLWLEDESFKRFKACIKVCVKNINANKKRHQTIQYNHMMRSKQKQLLLNNPQ